MHSEDSSSRSETGATPSGDWRSIGIVVRLQTATQGFRRFYNGFRSSTAGSLLGLLLCTLSVSVPDSMAQSSTASSAPTSILRYEPPSNFYRAAGSSVDTYLSTEVNAVLQVYPFRPYQGDIVTAFQRTLLREWIDLQYREMSVLGVPRFGRENVKGASDAIAAQFAQSGGMGPENRLRILIVAGAEAALVDFYANSPYSWQRAASAMQAMFGSMRVEAAPAAAALPRIGAAPGGGGADRSRVAGVYMGHKGHFVSYLNAVGGTWVPEPHFYLFSANGRVFRTFDPTAFSDAERFDYDAAMQTHPGETGRYSIEGGRMVIQMGNSPPITVPVGTGRPLLIEGVAYSRN